MCAKNVVIISVFEREKSLQPDHPRIDRYFNSTEIDVITQ